VRLIKMLGLAAIAVGAFMAFLGASSASATPLEEVVVCKVLQDPCSSSNHLGNGTILHGLASNPVLLAPGDDVFCSHSEVEGEIESLLAHGLIEEVTFTGCERGGEECTVSVNNEPFLAKGELKSTDSGYEILVTKPGSRPQANINCPGINCNFGANTILFEYLDPSSGALAVLDVLQDLSGEGGLCVFLSGTWHAQYTTSCLESTNPGTTVDCWLAME